MTELESVLEHTKMMARGIIESGETHIPIIIALTPHDVKIIDLARMQPEDKDVFKLVMGTILHLIGAYAYIFVNEAWVANLSKDSPLVPKIMSGEITVSELPLDDKDEILTIVVVENGKSCNFWSAKIQYQRDGSRYLGQWDKADEVGDGRLMLKEW